jgi:microsomal dipeptidase-like Zn-dependent dipeptidase
MNRREFMKYVAVLGASATLGNISACAHRLKDEKVYVLPQGMLLIDAHSHPDQLYTMGSKHNLPWDGSSTLEKIVKLGMQNSSFAAIGDSTNTDYTLVQVMNQVDHVIRLEEKGLIKIVRHHEDFLCGVPQKSFVPSAILSLEGASPLGDDKNTVYNTLDLLYRCGMRMITLMHNRDNQLGQTMKSGRLKTDGNGLSALGKNVIARMMELGIVVDVAHAHYPTLKDIIAVATANKIPVVDSHTSLASCESFCGGRLRTWEEMEMIAATGGVICTWPYKWKRADGTGRLTIRNWAEENFKIKARLGSQYITLGTDGAGLLPSMVDGYESILDLPKLLDAMSEVGFNRGEIEAYMGNNLLRVFKQCFR